MNPTFPLRAHLRVLLPFIGLAFIASISFARVNYTNSKVAITNGEDTFLSIDDVTNSEGDGGTVSYTFTVTRTGNTALSSSVNYETADDTATVTDSDYQSISDTLTFAENETTKTFTVFVYGDTTFEPDEAFTVSLSNASNATIDDGSGTGTILNDDLHVAPVVTNTNDSDAGSLRRALLDAEQGDTITFDIPTSDPGYNAGVWTINLTSGELAVDKDVTISGPGADVLIVRRDSNASPFRIFNVHSVGQVARNSNARMSLSSGVTIQGMTISNGIAFTGTPFIPGSGSGILNDHTNLTVASCVLSGNHFAFPFPPGNGGGIYNDGSVSGTATLTVINSVLSGNSVGFGGGIYNNGSAGGNASLTVLDSTLSGNSASEVGGGGIYNDGSGGGNASLIVTDSTLSGNSSSHGGGVYNTASSGGTVIATISDSTLNGNSGSQSGGAVFNDGGNGTAGLTITNSTLSGNCGDAGNAIANFGLNGIANLAITNSTLSENSSPNGYIINVGATTIGNTIVKTGLGGINFVNFLGSITSSGYNLSNDDGGGFLTAPGDQINSDPMLGPLKDNGGPTWTHAPLVNSPAIDQGKRDTIPALATNFDQRGLARPTNDPVVVDAAGSDGSDIGAVEVGVGVHPATAASWKTHGTVGSFPIDLPFSGPVGIECRSGGTSNDYQLIMTFAQPVSFSSAEVTSGVGSISGASADVGDASTSGVASTQVMINLTGVTNAQRVTVALLDVDDGTNHADVGIRMGVLLGDTTNDGSVNASDVSEVKMQSGQVLGADNFRADVIGNGSINASDVSAVKINSGSGIP